MEKKMVEFGLDFERKGTMLYLELASETGDSLSKHLFYTLAKQEIDHAWRIDKFNLDAGEQPRASGYGSMNSVEEEVRQFFKGMKDSMKRNKSNLQVYESAMKLEREGYRAYEIFLKEATDTGEKRLLEFLLGEEKKHMEAIANVYSYLSETSDWFEQEESRVWNWMNI